MGLPIPYLLLANAQINSCNTANKRCGSIGFAKCAFIPADFDFSTSSSKALAVIAMIGIVLASALSNSLIFLVASKPSITAS